MQSNRLSLPPLTRESIEAPRSRKKTLFIGKKCRETRAFHHSKENYRHNPKQRERKILDKFQENDENIQHQPFLQTNKYQPKPRKIAVKDHVLHVPSIESPCKNSSQKRIDHRKSRSFKKRRRKRVSSLRRKHVEIKDITTIQKYFRAWIARVYCNTLKRRRLFRLAAESGVLLVCMNSARSVKMRTDSSFKYFNANFSFLYHIFVVGVSTNSARRDWMVSAK